MKHITLAELEELIGDNNVQDSLRRTLIRKKGTYAEFIDQLYQDIDRAINALQATRESRQKDGEDRITLDILVSLGQHGYTADHDKKSGGHIDLSVRLGDYSWFAEAKKDGQFDEGLKQLTDRYVQPSGNFAHDHGGLLLYFVKTSNAKGGLDRWRERMTANGLQCMDCPRSVLAFYSTHQLTGSGTRLIVRNMVVALYHGPTDRSARTSAAKKARKGRAAE